MNNHGGRGSVMANSNSSFVEIPKHDIETLARCLLPVIHSYYESEEGKREFEEWKIKKAQSEEI